MRPEESLSIEQHAILAIDISAIDKALRKSDEHYDPAVILAARLKDAPAMDELIESFGVQTGFQEACANDDNLQAWLRNEVSFGLVAGFNLARSRRNPSPGLPFIVGGLKNKARAYAPGAIAAALAVMFSILCAGTGPSWKVFCCLLILAIFGAFIWRIASEHAKKSANVATQPAVK